MNLYLCQISDSCGFRLVSFTAQNVTAPDLPILGSFCKHLRNFVTKHSSRVQMSTRNGGLQGGLDFLTYDFDNL